MIIKKTSSEWDLENPVLALGDIGYETDTKKTKIGNGVSNWNASANYSALRYATVLIQPESFFQDNSDLIFELGVVLLESDTGKFKIADGGNRWSELSYEEIVTANRFNTLQSRIQQLLGNGSGNTGYGQGNGYGVAPSSSQVTTSDTVDSADMNNVYADIVRARIHQVGVTPTDISQLFSNNVIADDTSFFVDDLGNQSSDTDGTKKGLIDFENLMNTVELEKFSAHSSQMSLETALKSSRTALWNGTVYHEFDVTFDNADHRRHYFNSGGQIRFLSTNTSAPANSKGEKWGEFLTTTSAFSFNYQDNNTINVNNNYSTVYQQIASTTEIENNSYTIYAKATDTQTLTFKVEYVDAITTSTPVPEIIDVETFTNWSGIEIHKFTYVFADSGTRTQFFAQGNTVKFFATNNYTGADTRTTEWKSVINSMGNISFSSNETVSSLSVGEGTSIGSSNLTDVFQLIYRNTSSAYPEMNYSIYARNVTGTANIEFRVELNNLFDFSATRTCIAVIDESVGPQSGGPGVIRNDWIDFRAKWPDRPFYILWPRNPSTSFPQNAVVALNIPTEYIIDPMAYDPIEVSRDDGSISKRSDWFDLLGLDQLPYGSNVALFIDTSGSMDKSTIDASLNLFRSKLIDRGMDFYEVLNDNERWAEPFDNIPDGNTSNAVPNNVLGTTQSTMQKIGVSGTDENVEGRLESTVNKYRATGNAVEVKSPVFNTTTGLDTFSEPAPIYNLTSSRTVVPEGESFTIVLTTSNVPSGTSVPYVISGIDPGDISQGSLSGTITVFNNAGSIVFTPVIDGMLEPTETFTLSIQSGSTVFASISIDIINTALPTYTLSTNKATVEEGETFTITLTTTRVADGETVPYSIKGISSADISESLRGSFVMSGNVASKTFTAINDNLFEGISGTAPTNLIVNGSFETPGVPSGGLARYTGSITGWTTLDPTDVIEPHTNRNGVFPTDGNVWMDLDESPGNIRLGQNVQGIQPGTSYRLSFDIANSYTNAGNGVNVYWNGQRIYTNLTPGKVWESYTSVVVGNSGNQTNRLEFEGTGPEDNIGVSLDNVEMFEVIPLIGLGDTGDETFELELDNLEDKVEVLIVDAQKITYNLTSNKSSVTEGNVFTVTLNTSFLQDNTLVPYTITGVGTGDIDIPLTGNFIVSNNTAEINIQAQLDANSSEGDEVLTLSLNNGASSVSVTLQELILPTSAERTCIAVIDESSIGGYDPSRSTLSGSWTDFRTKWPNRPFYLLQPNIETNGSRKYAGTSIDLLNVPNNFINDTLATGPIEVYRDNDQLPRSDWYDICNLDSLPDGSKIALFIDTSGSMNISTVQRSLTMFRNKLAARNMEVIEVYNQFENWIEPFNKILD